ncbi:IS21 family transposase [Nonomuraea sp. NPDC050451]|uniref:IS21 family transposase n=1 Tax=Nonomuraea sp. NPDC050451 TaxID=3364364 RepID=UPI0037A12ABF
MRRFRALRESGASISEIARETGLNWRTVKKYLEADGPVASPASAARPSRRQQAITQYAPMIDARLRAELLLKATVIHERLVEEYGFTGNCQPVKLYLQQARSRIAEELGYTPNELARLHRRFEVVPGAQAQVDWGDEGGVLAHVGIVKVYSFHMTLSYSRDPFCCFTTSQDLATFWACHRRAFEHFGGVPGSIVYDRTKTVVRRHVAPGKAVPLHPEAVAFAGHYDFDIDVLAADRPTGKRRVERQVLIVRDHVLAGRSFASLDELDNAFLSWVPMGRRTVHRPHGEVIGIRARRDHAALRPVPARPYLVTDRHLRHVGKDCLVAFEANLYSVPAARVFPRQLVEVRVLSDGQPARHRPGRARHHAAGRASTGHRARRAHRRPRALEGTARRTHPRHH